MPPGLQVAGISRHRRGNAMDHMPHKRRRQDSELVRQLKERVKKGNLPYFDPLVDGRHLHFEHALSLHYGGFKVGVLVRELGVQRASWCEYHCTYIHARV